MNKATCYMCDAPETSREHVPPRCLFPEKGTYGKNLRKNLITVPSCEAHNTRKSTDDEFLRTAITIFAGNNKAGQHQFFEKTIEGVKRRPESYRPFFQDKGPIPSVHGRALKIDRNRLDRCIDHIVRALIFNKYNEKWLYEIDVYTPNLFSDIVSGVPVAHEFTKKIVEIIRPFLASASIQGENPAVFKYRIRYDPVECGFAFAGIFYDSFEVYAVPAKLVKGETG